MSLSPLPIDDCLADLLAALRASRCAVLQAPPGAGKTTRVPPAILQSGIAGDGKILVLQPRRVAARATAARIAAEQGWRLGEEVGFQVRFESRTSPRTRIELITEGILLQRLRQDPFLEGVSVVLFDEFHERSLTSDLSLAMTRQVQQSVREDLRILVMSATLSAEPIAAYLDSCPIIRSEGRLFPIDIRYSPTLDRQPLPEAVTAAVTRLPDELTGDCLVFLPGLGEIRQVSKRLQHWADERQIRLLELYGDLPGAQQDEVLQPSAVRKVILSTNVAETSLTIPGVTAVIDSGLARIARYDEATGLDKLELSPISRASANQRAGRAGRTAPGICIRLWPEAMQRLRPEFDEPELKRVDLAGAVLTILNWAEPDLHQFPWFEAPSAITLQRAIHLLERLAAVEDGQITTLGRSLAALPVHPRLGRLLIEGKQRGIAHEVATAAALLSERDLFLRANLRPGDRRTPSHRSANDLSDRIAALDAFDQHGQVDSPAGTINRSAANQVFHARDQLLRLVRSEAKRTSSAVDPDEALGRALLAAFPDRLARLREPGSRRALMVGGRGVKLADQSAVSGEELFLAIDVEASTGEANVRMAAGVERDWLSRDLLTEETTVSYDEAQQRVISQKVVRWDDLVLDARQAAYPAAEQVANVLAAAANERWEQAYPADNENLTSFVTRVRCLNQWMPDLDLPTLSEERLRSLLPELCLGCKSLADLRRGPWLQSAKALFTYQQLQQVEREAPERIGVPSGSQITIQYEVNQPPILAVRIQEIFGLMDTPRLAGNRVPVLMHLLAPNMRVAQVTADLKSFWANTYSLVRKDLRNRYPKHSWPENPYEALPQKRPQRRPPG
ncbi:ATP-dependent RNA helicase HrpB [Anatilimnocola aggregata]|uniref:ATP-dependent RNA helicase HrpB n=1 Tax=Anatilimnocola aggregata TaxID=2528021 RepID=A0A517Y678_9BACT|nr:ATP-dependent helicase HrpB [Anatilimnocola aggregata]QDU25733.1 ATP-dependent RNA helicase HrpB [Anatilimnocola aggregata]